MLPESTTLCRSFQSLPLPNCTNTTLSSLREVARSVSWSLLSSRLLIYSYALSALWEKMLKTCKQQNSACPMSVFCGWSLDVKYDSGHATCSKVSSTYVRNPRVWTSSLLPLRQPVLIEIITWTRAAYAAVILYISCYFYQIDSDSIVQTKPAESGRPMETQHHPPLLHLPHC